MDKKHGIELDDHWKPMPSNRNKEDDETFIMKFLYFIFLFMFLGGISFTDTEEIKSVSVMEGDSVTLHPDDELQKDDLILWWFSWTSILLVEFNRFTNVTSFHNIAGEDRFKDKLNVNTQTGSLTITNITTEHNGVYQVEIINRRKSSYKRFSVGVYARLPVPVITRDYSQCSNCSLLCSVLNVTHVSLSWYKGNSLLSIISVSDLNIRLSLPLEVEYQDNTKYGCMVNNTITNQTQHLNIKHLCWQCLEPDSPSVFPVLMSFIVVSAVLVMFAVVCDFYYIGDKWTSVNSSLDSQHQGREKYKFYDTNETCKTFGEHLLHGVLGHDEVGKVSVMKGDSNTVSYRY